MTNAYIHIACTKKIPALLKKNASKNGIIVQDKALLKIKNIAQKSALFYINDAARSFVFTSANAVKSVANFIKKHHLSTKINCFVLSGATKTEAAKHQYHIIAHADSATELATAIVQNNPKKIVHCTTQNHRPELYETLKNSGILIDKLLVYETINMPQKFDFYDALAFFSPSQITVFLENNELKAQIPVFCIGKTTAAHAYGVGYRSVFAAPTPTATAVFYQIYNYFGLKCV